MLSAIQLRDENLRRAWLTSPKRREVALAHDRMLLEAFEAGDSEMARSIATVRVDTREQWIESPRSGTTDRAVSQPATGDERELNST